LWRCAGFSRESFANFANVDKLDNPARGTIRSQPGLNLKHQWNKIT